MKVKRIVGLWLAVLFAAMQLMCGLAFADGEKTETVIHTCMMMHHVKTEVIPVIM